MVKTVTLYSVRVTWGSDPEMVSVEAEEHPKTYRALSCEGGGFSYRTNIRKAGLAISGIALTEQEAINLFISKCNRAIELCHSQIEREQKHIAAVKELQL